VPAGVADVPEVEIGAWRGNKVPIGQVSLAERISNINLASGESL
jgi:hypothetical protein